ncbi:hypothetical protein KB20921_28260 [Edwardsiella ictaluri]|nr:hypothetical protein KH20906_28120 [Edwardsiella ictaluri]BEI03565.1 hypothetical protein KB20921_28260 [Edwardsiella ictaluri]BEI07023.1 hypothetical protein KH201010_28090 [Edwardsiella ictaluri]BEI10494.1 hypothetical protein STU22726_28250 [Edwardsiella ictaluri]BEI13971.1 hypothetical protein STU22816_28240 [Edwardsiella ictaluri]
MTDANGLPLSLVVAADNTHDIKLVADTHDALQMGRSGKKLGLCLDKGYEAGWQHTCRAAVTSRISSPVKGNQMPVKPQTSRPIAGSLRGRIAG